MSPAMFIFIAALLNIGSKIPTALAMLKQPKGYDNRHPREQQKRLESWGARGLAAHQNTMEGFPIFAAGMLVMLINSPESSYINTLGYTYLISRVLYIVLYVADIHLLRSLVWGVGFVASLALFVV